MGRSYHPVPGGVISWGFTREAGIRLVLAIGALLPALLFCPARAQNGAAANGPSVAFAPVTVVPIPLQSTSGRFSSLNPAKRRTCSNKKVTGRVVSAHLVMVDEPFCGRGQSSNVLVNVALSNPADAMQMVVGRRVEIVANFKNAEENRTAEFYADYLIAEKARIVAADPAAAPAPAFTSYMMCQPPELDTLARQLGRELCVQSTIVENLAATRPALETAARVPEDAPPDTGDPNAITCRPDRERSDIHLPAIACARGSYWAWYNIKWRDFQYSTPAPP